MQIKACVYPVSIQKYRTMTRDQGVSFGISCKTDSPRQPGAPWDKSLSSGLTYRSFSESHGNLFPFKD